MSDKELADKKAYFADLELLDISDDETGFPDERFEEAKRLLLTVRADPEDTEEEPSPPPPPPRRKTYGFLGPTPQELQAQFEAQAEKRRALARSVDHGLVRSMTAPEPAVSSVSFPAATKKRKATTVPSEGISRAGKLRHSNSVPDLPVAPVLEFYKRVGDIPRPLSRAKKDAVIKLYPESRQLFKGKIIYFYPNDDIAGDRRMRIHKVIQLGGAWVRNWRSDIDYVMVDLGYNYQALMKHLKMAALPEHIRLVKFEPYVNQSIMLRELLDPTERRFIVDGAPSLDKPLVAVEPQSSVQIPSSLPIKRTRRQRLAEASQKTASRSDDDSLLPSQGEDVVEDSFVAVASSAQPPALFEGGDTQIYDALSEAIDQTKAIAHLPIDEDSDDTSSRLTASSGAVSETDTSDSEPTARKTSLKGKGKATVGNVQGGRRFDQSNFQCMKPNDGDRTGNPNARTIQVLQEMGKYYDQMQDQWRTLAYRKAINTLAKQKRKITTKEEALALPYIGSRLADKIEEIVLTDKLRKLDHTKDDPTDKLLRLFMGVYGAGLSQANKWIQQGYRSLEDLVQRAKLTPSQKVGIEHYDDFATRIPRKEVEAHGDYVRQALRKIDPRFEVIIMGSYRRGAKDTGDIDLIITKKGASVATMRSTVFDKLVPRLFKEGFLKVSLATSHHNDGTKWHGASCLPGSEVWRRLDLLLVPEAEMGAALIYFTGNEIFNRSIRLLASKKGMRLNQRGLYKDVVRGRNREKLNEGTLVEGRDEKRIFEILGVPWREPNQRIC